MYVRRVSCLWVSCFAFIEFHQALMFFSDTLSKRWCAHHTSADQSNVLHSFERSRTFCELFLHALWLVNIAGTWWWWWWWCMWVSEVKWSEVKWSGSEWVGEWVSEGGREWGSEWLSVCVWVGEWVSGWVSGWVSEWVNEWVSAGVISANESVIRPLGSAHCATPATQKRRRPKGRQGVHPTPWQCTLCHACHAKEAETQGTPGRTSDPLAVYIVPRLPRKRGGDPRDARAYIRPLGSAHCATPATQKRRRPKGRQGVHPTPWQCTLCHACHAKAAETQGTPGRTSDPLAVHIVPRLPRKSGGDPRDARAYIRPLGSAHCATPATQKRRRPKRRQGVHPIPWQCTLCHACHAKAAENQGTPGAYIRPLGSAHYAAPATQKRRSEWVSEWVSGWVSEWMSGWECEWVSGWVSGWAAGEAAGGGRRNTELKTKTPHVNVGKNRCKYKTQKNMWKKQGNIFRTLIHCYWCIIRILALLNAFILEKTNLEEHNFQTLRKAHRVFKRT